MTPAARLLVQQLAQRGEFMCCPHTTLRLTVDLVREVALDHVHGEWGAKAVEEAIDRISERGEG